MTNNETILKQVIEKAVKNGYGEDYGSDIETRSITILSEYTGYESHDIEHLIFDHNFAEAFFGEGDVLTATQDGTWDDCKREPFHIYHLQQMVLEKEPLQYLKKYL